MKRLRLIGAFVAAVLAVAMALSMAGGAVAADLPTIVKGKGEACVEDTQTMRRFHMDMLKHQRDDTLRKGVRGAKASLKDCVSCHATTGADGKPVPVNAPGQFCQSCHSYAAVSIDCFECHATTPGTTGAHAAAR